MHGAKTKKTDLEAVVGSGIGQQWSRTESELKKFEKYRSDWIRIRTIFKPGPKCPRTMRFVDAWIEPIKSDRPLFILSAVILNVKRTKSTKKYFSSFYTLGRSIFTNSLFFLDSKGSMDLIFVSA